MKRILALLVMGAVAVVASAISTKPQHRVVFDAGTDEASWEGLLNNVENLQKAFAGDGGVQIAVIAHGKALGLLLADGRHAERVERIAATGVVFAACENTMRRQKVTKAQLHPRATTVDSGVAELVRRQEAGWSYIKAGG